MISTILGGFLAVTAGFEPLFVPHDLVTFANFVIFMRFSDYQNRPDSCLILRSVRFLLDSSTQAAFAPEAVKHHALDQREALEDGHASAVVVDRQRDVTFGVLKESCSRCDDHSRDRFVGHVSSEADAASVRLHPCRDDG